MPSPASRRRRFVILSTPLILDEGNYSVRRVTEIEARDWVKHNKPINYCGHATVELLGLVPAAKRTMCRKYDEALTIRTKRRLAIRREYSVKEIKELGVDFLLITRVSDQPTATDLKNAADTDPLPPPTLRRWSDRFEPLQPDKQRAATDLASVERRLRKNAAETALLYQIFAQQHGGFLITRSSAAENRYARQLEPAKGAKSRSGLPAATCQMLFPNSSSP